MIKKRSHEEANKSTIEELKEELKSSKIDFVWQRKAIKKKLEDIKTKVDQLFSIENLSKEKQIETHFKILILNYLVSNNMSEDLIINLGTVLFFFKLIILNSYSCFSFTSFESISISESESEYSSLLVLRILSTTTFQ